MCRLAGPQWEVEYLFSLQITDSLQLSLQYIQKFLYFIYFRDIYFRVVQVALTLPSPCPSPALTCKKLEEGAVIHCQRQRQSLGRAQRKSAEAAAPATS